MKPAILSKDRPQLLVWLVLNGIAQAGLGIGLGILMEHMLNPDHRLESAMQHSAMAAVLLLGAVSIVSLRAWQRRDSEAFGLSYVHDLRVAIFRHACALPATQPRSVIGPTLSRLTNDLLAVKNWVSYGIATLIVAATTIAGSISFLAFVDPKLAMVSALSLFIALLCAGAFVYSLRQRVKASRRIRGRLVRHISNKLAARLTIQSLNRMDSEAKRVAELSSELTHHLVHRGFYSGFIRFIPLASLPIAVCLLSALQVWSLPPYDVLSTTGTSNFVWLVVMGLAITQLQDATRALDYRINYEPAMRRLNSFWAIQTAAERPNSASDSIGGDAPLLTIEFESKGTSSNVRKSCQAGETVLVQGASEQYISALFHEVARFDILKPGRVFLHQGDAASIPLRKFRTMVGLVSPSVPLMSGTVGGNLRKSRIDLSRPEDLAPLLRACEIDADTDRWAEFLDQPVSDTGLYLSAAQTARLRLAIALARKPFLVLIDDGELRHSPCLINSLLAHCAPNGIAVLIGHGPDHSQARYTQVWNLQS